MFQTIVSVPSKALMLHARWWYYIKLQIGKWKKVHKTAASLSGKIARITWFPCIAIQKAFGPCQWSEFAIILSLGSQC